MDVQNQSAFMLTSMNEEYHVKRFYPDFQNSLYVSRQVHVALKCLVRVSARVRIDIPEVTNMRLLHNTQTFKYK